MEPVRSGPADRRLSSTHGRYQGPLCERAGDRTTVEGQAPPESCDGAGGPLRPEAHAGQVCRSRRISRRRPAAGRRTGGLDPTHASAARVDQGPVPPDDKETKRDWHKLLEYNRHDCLALRHIVLTATRELECWRAYETTRFCVEDGARRVCFMAGSRSSKLDALLRRHGADHWAFLTAWNPGSVSLPHNANDTRQRELENQLAADGFSLLRGEGRGKDPEWPAEESFLVLGITRRQAVTIARRFGQLAIVAGRRGRPARLVPCSIAGPGRRVRAT